MGVQFFYLLIQSVFLLSFIKWLMLFTFLFISRYHSQKYLSFREMYWLFIYGYFIYFNKCLFFHIFVGHKFVHVRSNLLFSHSVMSNSLRLHELQHSRLPCPLLFPWVCSNSCALSPWCHPIISSSVAPFSSCLHSLPASGLSQWIDSSHQVARVFELQLSISPSNEYSGLISFRIDWFNNCIISPL